MINDLNKHVIIRCPKCGYEYLASEIFYPEDLLGKSTDIIRDDNGKIIFLGNGEEPELTENWECEHCGCEFQAKLNIKGETIYDNNYDFSDDYQIAIDDDKESLF